MDEREKIFSIVDWVLLLTIAGISDSANAAAILIFPTPVVGQVVLTGKEYLVSPITYAIIQGWFIMKTHGGRTSIGTFTKLLPVFGGLGNFATIPGIEIITTAFAMWMADHPKVAGVAAIAGAAALTGGVGAAAGAGEAGAAAGAAAEAETAVGAGAAAARAETGVATQVEANATNVEAGAGEEASDAAKKEIAPEALGGQKEIPERVQEELFQNTPGRETAETQSENPEQAGLNDENNEVDLRKAA